MPINFHLDPEPKVKSWEEQKEEMGLGSVSGQTSGGNLQNIPKPAPTSPVDPTATIKTIKDPITGLITVDQESLAAMQASWKLHGLSTEVTPAVPKPAVEYYKGPVKLVGKLADATKLNQPVAGTSAGSVYRVVAVGPRAKVAARLKGGQLSVRVEGKLNTAETNALLKLGFKNGGGYMSNHYTLGNCPPERVLGALLFTEELELTATVKKMSEVADGK